MCDVITDIAPAKSELAKPVAPRHLPADAAFFRWLTSLSANFTVTTTVSPAYAISLRQLDLTSVIG